MERLNNKSQIRIVDVDREVIPVDNAEFEETKRLERKYRAGRVILDYPGTSRCDRMLLHWMAGVLMRSKDADAALLNWRSIPITRGRNREDFTPSQLGEVDINDQEVVDLYNQVQNSLSLPEQELEAEIAVRMVGSYGHKWNDAYEQRQDPKRSLGLLRASGVRIHIPVEYEPLLKMDDGEDPARPIFDRVKNIRMVDIDGFDSSKISLMAHDVFDHYWLFAILEQNGILDRYREFLRSVGNPQSTDIFSREGELIASTAFDYRGFQVSEPGFVPLLNLDRIKRMLHRPLRRSKMANVHSDNQVRAWDYLQSLDPESNEAKSLQFIVSGVAIEMMEQRRKVGFIKLLDSNFVPTEPLRLFNPEYVALIVEINRLLNDPVNRADQVILNISAMIEDYLIAKSRDGLKDDLVIKLDDMESFIPEESRVSADTLEWMKRNPGFTATRKDIY